VTIDETLEFQAMKLFAEDSVRSQRILAKLLGVSLGKANNVVRNLASRGLVTVESVSRNSNREGSIYQLTSKGMIEKLRLTRRFLEQKVAEYDRLQKEIDALAREVGVPDIRMLAG